MDKEQVLAQPSPATLGLRERNKADKLQRIQQAARELFIEKGYDDTTTREIARRADVGLGTLFSYASDKRDLLFLIFNSELEQVIDEASRNALEDAPFLDQLLIFFRSFYRFFAQQPALSRFMLRELTFYVSGTQARRFQQGRDNLLRCLGVLAANAQAANRIGTSEELEIIAQALFSIYASELRRWLSVDNPDLESGLAHLRRMLRLQILGLEPRDGAI